MDVTIDIPRRLPLLLVSDNVLLPGSSMRIPVRSIRKYVFTVLLAVIPYDPPFDILCDDCFFLWQHDFVHLYYVS